MSTPLSQLDIENFTEQMDTSRARASTYSASASNMNMTDRFDDTEIRDTDVILTTKASEQVRILLGQLVNSQNFIDANYDIT